MVRNAMAVTEVAVKGENSRVILDRGQLRDLLKEENVTGVYKYALHERSLSESVGEPVRELTVGVQGGVLTETRPKAESVISSAKKDRDGDIMNQAGMIITENYERNPTVFGLHSHTIPVGFTELIRQYAALSWARWQWLVDVSQSEGKDYYEMWEKHVLNCTSVGFLINAWAPLDGDDFFGGWDIKEWELLEHSPVSLPSNREAMRTDGLKSLFRSYVERIYDGPSPVLRKMFEEIESDYGSMTIPVSVHLSTEQDLRRAVREGVEDALKGGKDTANVSLTCSAGAVEVKGKGAISYNTAHPDGTPTADIDREWDNGKERAAADIDDLKVMCAWVEDGSGDNKGDYKFAHHHQENKAVNKRACTAAIGVLNGGRGGTNIPEEDRSGVYAHVRKHLIDDFGVAPDDVPELKAVSFEDVRLAAAAGAITVDEAFERLQKVFKATKDALAENEIALAAAQDKIHGLETQIATISAEIVETLG